MAFVRTHWFFSSASATIHLIETVFNYAGGGRGWREGGGRLAIHLSHAITCLRSEGCHKFSTIGTVMAM